MLTFILSVVLLICGYCFYGKLVENNFGPDARPTPAIAHPDGVDYIVLPTWKVFLIQLLNIAGTGPIFGAISGALFGPIAYLWVVFGSIFAGAVHDYYIGMISIRHNGESVSELTGRYLGKHVLFIMRIIAFILLVMIGVVFTYGPAGLFALISPAKLDLRFWYWIIFSYYFFATFVNIDKIIGRFYPIFGFCLIAMALGVGTSLLVNNHSQMPELWNSFKNFHPNLSPWPFMFVTIACGAISGFHSTQSPLMARCIKDEKDGRWVFYGSMIIEGFIALVWVAAGITCYENSTVLFEILGKSGPSAVVYDVCQRTLGSLGMILAMLGVIACPITSGDTAYRAARLTLADWLKIDQSKLGKRLYTTIPLLVIGLIIGELNYNLIWRYVSYTNQLLAAVVLWVITVYLYKNKKNYWYSLVPAIFVSIITTWYAIVAPELLGGLL